MRVIIEPDYEAVSKWAADHVIEAIAKAAPTAGKPFVLGLPTGSTPIGMYDELVASHRAGRVSFEHVITFNMDEYVGLPEDHPASYHAFMWEHLLSRIDIPKSNINILDGNAPDLERECAAYEERIAQSGGVDLFIGGLGRNGHIAFNEPGSPLTSRTRAVSLSRETVAANARFFDDDPDQVPRKALTVGVGTILDAREVLILANGTAKALALRHAIEDDVNDRWPVSAIQRHPRSIILCDRQAASKLSQDTVERFAAK